MNLPVISYPPGSDSFRSGLTFLRRRFFSFQSRDLLSLAMTFTLAISDG